MINETSEHYLNQLDYLDELMHEKINLVDELAQKNNKLQSLEYEIQRVLQYIQTLEKNLITLHV